ncbi:unnamed protein product, partial [Polarella glacialis]
VLLLILPSSHEDEPPSSEVDASVVEHALCVANASVRLEGSLVWIVLADSGSSTPALTLGFDSAYDAGLWACKLIAAAGQAHQEDLLMTRISTTRHPPPTVAVAETRDFGVVGGSSNGRPAPRARPQLLQPPSSSSSE